MLNVDHCIELTPQPRLSHSMTLNTKYSPMGTAMSARYPKGESTMSATVRLLCGFLIGADAMTMVENWAVTGLLRALQARHHSR